MQDSLCWFVVGLSCSTFFVLLAVDKHVHKLTNTYAHTHIYIYIQYVHACMHAWMDVCMYACMYRCRVGLGLEIGGLVLLQSMDP